MFVTGGYGGGGGGFRIMQFNNYNSTKTFHLTSSFSVILQPFLPNTFKFFRNPFCFSSKSTYRNTTRVSYELQPNPLNTQNPLLPDCLSQCEGDQEAPSEIMCPLAGGIVALGKFDALHIGHRELAIQAAKMGNPYLLSFVGMAEVLGWEPRAPIVAKCDRQRVLSTWSELCNGTTPREFEVEFSNVRSLTPRQFVEKLSKELGVRGVVAGENYRFGYRAAGNASDLVTICRDYDIEACIISSVMDKNRGSSTIKSGDSKDQGQVSSTRVRLALANGDMGYVSELLGRHHRLLLPSHKPEKISSSRTRISAPASSLLNLPPKDGLYENCSLYIDEMNCSPCRVTIEESHVHVDLDEVDNCMLRLSLDTKILGIEFGELQYDCV